MRSKRCLLLLVTVAALVGCEGHGKYTSEFLDDVEEDRARLRAATEYDQAVQRFQSGDLSQALEAVDRAISLDDQAALAYLLRGRILLEQGQSEYALESLARGLALNPRDPGYAYYRGIAFERLGHPELALTEYRSAAALDPTAPQYVLASAEVLVALDRFEDARQLLLSQGGEFRSTPGFHQALGHIAMLEGDYDRAVRHLENAAMLDPTSTVLREDLAQAQIAAEDFAAAEVTLRRLIEDIPGDDRRDLLHLRASCLLQLERAAEARNVLYHLIRSKDGASDLEAWVKMIDVALLLHDDGLLRMTANRLMAVAPDRYEGHLALAMWQRQSGDLEGAIRSTERAMTLAEEDPAPQQLHLILGAEFARGAG